MVHLILRLKAPPWEGLPHDTSLLPPHPSSSSPSPPPPSAAPLHSLLSSLHNRRLYRELSLSLSSTLQDVKAEFSFLRLKGLTALLDLLSALSTSEVLIRLFQESQTVDGLQVAHILFEHILAPKSQHSSRGSCTSVEDSLLIVNPPTDSEVVLALRILEGCCLLDKGSRIIASCHMAIKEVIELLTAGGVQEQSACLGVLPVLMLDTYVNVKEFITQEGVKKISEFVKHGHVDETMRLKCAEFLIIFVGNLLPKEYDESESVVNELQNLLGNVFTSVIRGAEQVLETNSEWEIKQRALTAQAKRLLDLLDSSC